MDPLIITVKIDNLYDLFEVRSGQLTPEQVRQVVVHDAIVNTQFDSVQLPLHLIDELGLIKRLEPKVTPDGERYIATIYEPIRVEIQGREAPVDPIEAPEGSPVIIGRIPLKVMNWMIDYPTQSLINNPNPAE